MATKTMCKVEVYTLEAGRRYAAPSSKGDGTAYEIIIHSPEAGDISCNCKGYEFRRTCKHVAAVKASLLAVTEAERAEFERRIADLY
jgi:uncharacterized Zn finger protein